MSATRLRAPAPASSGQILYLDTSLLLTWARAIARGVRADFGFVEGSPEELELEGVALEALHELSLRLDETRLPVGGNLVGAFKGWAGRDIRSRCRRHALTLRNGGTFRTTSLRKVKRQVVKPLPVSLNEGRPEVMLEAQPVEEPDLDEDVVTRKVMLAPRLPPAVQPNLLAWRAYLKSHRSAGTT